MIRPTRVGAISTFGALRITCKLRSLKKVCELLDLASGKRVALMCAEAVPWRCHRSLISDALLIRGLEVRHIISAKSFPFHQLTSFAIVEGDRITYPEIMDR